MNESNFNKVNTNIKVYMDRKEKAETMHFEETENQENDNIEYKENTDNAENEINEQVSVETENNLGNEMTENSDEEKIIDKDYEMTEYVDNKEMIDVNTMEKVVQQITEKLPNEQKEIQVLNAKIKGADTYSRNKANVDGK